MRKTDGNSSSHPPEDGESFRSGSEPGVSARKRRMPVRDGFSWANALPPGLIQNAAQCVLSLYSKPGRARESFSIQDRVVSLQPARVPRLIL
jgi:hypothetical protein